MLHLGMTS